MSEEKFSYKEAIKHGWNMTRKYWQPLLLVAIIYILFQILSGVLDSYAGRDKMSREDVAAVYKDRAQGDEFYKYLKAMGYIDESGNVQKILQDIDSPDALTLPSEFEGKRNDIFSFLNQFRYRLPFPKPVFYLISFILWVLSMLMMIGSTKISLIVSRDQGRPSVAELFTNGTILIPYILGSVCYFLVVLGGFILLIIPGIILSIVFQMYSYLIIDKGLGPIESLKRSRVITKGQRWRLFVFGMILALLNVAGFLCLVVGLFFTMWTSVIATAHVYDLLENA